MSAEEAAKERIIAAARDRFFKEGFGRTSVDQLTADLGMSKKTFYKHFKSKEDLVGQIMQRTIGGVGARITLIVNDTRASFLEKLNLIMRELGTQLSQFGQAFQLDLQRFAPDIWHHIETFRREMLMANITRLVRQGKNEGYIRPSINERIFILAYLAAVNSIVRPNVLAEESFSAVEALHGIMTIFFAGILTEDAANQLQAFEHSKEK